MSFHDKLSTSLGDIGDTLWGSGRQNWSRGALLAGRLGATNALTDYRKSQTRDLDFDYDNKVTLLNALKQAKAGTPEFTQYQGLMSGEGMKDWAGGQAQAFDLAQKMKAFENMETAKGVDGKLLIDPVTQLALRMGQTGPQSSLMAQRLGETPVKLEGLQDKNTMAHLLAQEKVGSEVARRNKINALTDFNIARTNNLNEVHEFKLQEAEQKFANAVSTGNKLQAATDLAILNQQIAGNKVDGQEAISAEFDRVSEEFKLNPNKPLNPYQSFILNQGRTGKKVTGTDLTKAVTRKDEKALMGEKVKLTKEKTNKITKQIEKLELDKVKTLALTNLYIAREEKVKSGKANGNVSITQAGALYKALMGEKHKNSQGKSVRWGKLTKEEQTAIYERGVENLLKGAKKLQKGLPEALGQTGGTGNKGDDLKSQLDTFLERK